jgi:hypothetical protein
MKRNALMIMLLVAGVLALLYLSMWAPTLLFFFVPRRLPPGVGSVSAGHDEREVALAASLVLGSSLLLWRACASLAAGGDRVMAWHARFHGRAALAGLLLISSVVGLAVLSFSIFPPDAMRPGGDWTLILVLAAMALVLASFGLNVMQLYSVVAAFKRRT